MTETTETAPAVATTSLVLIAVKNAGGHLKGAIITDATKIERLLSSHLAHAFVRARHVVADTVTAVEADIHHDA